MPSDAAGVPWVPRPDGSYRIEIPAAGIRDMVQEGIDDEPLGRGPGVITYPDRMFTFAVDALVTIGR